MTAQQCSDGLSEDIMRLAQGHWVAIGSLETQFIAQRAMVAVYALRHRTNWEASNTDLSLLTWAQKELILKSWKWPEYKERVV